MADQCGSGSPCVACAEVTACVALSAAVGNQITKLADGLFVPAWAGTQIAAGPGITVAGTQVAGFAIAVRPSTDAGNAVRFGGDDGLFVPECIPSGVTAVADTPTVDMTLTGSTASAAVRRSATAGNLITLAADGLFVPVAGGDADTLISGDPGNDLHKAPVDGLLWTPLAPPAPPAGAGLTFDPATGYHIGAGPGVTVAADQVSAKLSADANNLASFGGDGGLFVPAASIPITAVDSTATIAMGVTGGVITGDVKRSAQTGNALQARADGLWTPLATAPTGASLISADAGNVLTTGSDTKLRVPAPPARPLPGPGLADDAVTFTVKPGNGLNIVGSNPGAIAVKLSIDAGNLIRFGTDGGVLATAPTTVHSAIALQAVPNFNVVLPATTALQTMPTTGAVVADTSSGFFTYSAGVLTCTRTCYARADVSFSVYQTAIASQILDAKVNLGATVFPFEARINDLATAGFTTWLTVTAGQQIILQLGLHAAGTSFTATIAQLSIVVTWLADR